MEGSCGNSEEPLTHLILQLRKLRHRKVKVLGQGPTASKQWTQDLNPSSLVILLYFPADVPPLPGAIPEGHGTCLTLCVHRVAWSSCFAFIAYQQKHLL